MKGEIQVHDSTDEDDSYSIDHDVILWFDALNLLMMMTTTMMMMMLEELKRS